MMDTGQKFSPHLSIQEAEKQSNEETLKKKWKVSKLKIRATSFTCGYIGRACHALCTCEATDYSARDAALNKNGKT